MWIESHQELAKHPKLKRLARYLGISKHAAIGVVHMLWWWALDYAQQGKLAPPYDINDIADAIELDNVDANTLVEALLDSRFLDKTEDDTIVIHDWYDYAGKLLDKRERDRERKAKKNSC